MKTVYTVIVTETRSRVVTVERDVPTDGDTPMGWTREAQNEARSRAISDPSPRQWSTTQTKASVVCWTEHKDVAP